MCRFGMGRGIRLEIFSFRMDGLALCCDGDSSLLVPVSSWPLLCPRRIWKGEIAMALSRLSPHNIADDLKRATLYREIRAGAVGWREREIQPDEVLRPELIAYRHYGTEDMAWAVRIAAGLDDPREAMEAGVKIILPPLTFVRERIKALSE